MTTQMTNEQLRNTHNKEKTNFPDFWDRYNWGGAKSAGMEEAKNRDSFLNCFTKSGKLMLTYSQSAMKNTHKLMLNHHNTEMDGKIKRKHNYHMLTDHTEYYHFKSVKDPTTGIVKKCDLKIIMYHPYSIDKEHYRITVKNGFYEVKPMYAHGVKSFIKIVKSWKKATDEPSSEYVAAEFGYDIKPLLLPRKNEWLDDLW